MSSKKIELNRFKKIKYLDRKNWTFETLLRNAINTFHEEFKVFRLEKRQQAKMGMGILTENAIIIEFHKGFVKSCVLDDPAYTLHDQKPMDSYQIMFIERFALAKNLRLKFLKLHKTRTNKLLNMMIKTHETNDYRFAADAFNLSNKETRRLLTRITNQDRKIDVDKVMRYQTQEWDWGYQQFDEKMFNALLYSGAAKEDVLYYLYSRGIYYYSLSGKDRRRLESLVSQIIKNVSKIIKNKRKTHSKT